MDSKFSLTLIPHFVFFWKITLILKNVFVASLWLPLCWAFRLKNKVKNYSFWDSFLLSSMALLVSMHRSKSHFKIFKKHGGALKNCLKNCFWFCASYRCHADYRRLHKFPKPYYPVTCTFKNVKNSTGVIEVTQV